MNAAIIGPLGDKKCHRASDIPLTFAGKACFIPDG